MPLLRKKSAPDNPKSSKPTVSGPSAMQPKSPKATPRRASAQITSASASNLNLASSSQTNLGYTAGYAPVQSGYGGGGPAKGAVLSKGPPSQARNRASVDPAAQATTYAYGQVGGQGNRASQPPPPRDPRQMHASMQAPGQGQQLPMRQRASLESARVGGQAQGRGTYREVLLTLSISSGSITDLNSGITAFAR
jgi:hypothetical protein